MKTFFTLLFTVTSLTSVVAQRDNDNNKYRQGRQENSNDYSTNNSNDSHYSNNQRKDYAYNDRRYNESYPMNSRERDFQIQKINREYEYEIQSVNANRYMRPREKKIAIRSLENQRRDQIMNLQSRYYDKRNRYNDGGGKW